MSSCCIDFEPATIFREDWVKARKEHHCCECGSVIAKGEEYQRITGLYEGRWHEYKTCEPCADLRESLSEVDCPYYEGLSECFQEWLNSGPNTVMSVKPGTHAAKLVPSYYLE